MKKSTHRILTTHVGSLIRPEPLLDCMRAAGGDVIGLDRRVDLDAAKIGTMGERAEDVFYVTDRARRPLADEAAQRLRTRLMEALNPQTAA